MADLSNNTVFSQADASNTSGTVPTWQEGMVPSLVNDSARALQGSLKRFYDHANATIASGGTANVQTLTYTVAPAAYVAGDRYTFRVGSTLNNTGATTIDVNGLGAKAIQIGENALVGGELRQFQVADIVYDGTVFLLNRPIVPVSAGFLPANPTGTSDGTGLMMGIGATCAFTPTVSGSVAVWVTGNVTTDTNGSGSQMQIRYGTGAAPANGAALSGTTSGSLIAQSCTAANELEAFMLLGNITGLVIGTAHWIDLRLSNSSAGAEVSTLSNISVIVKEAQR
jgi:hypothetical protein